MKPADHNATATIGRLLDLLDNETSMSNPETRDLFNLLVDQDMQAVLLAHDDIARKSFSPLEYPSEPEAGRPYTDEPAPHLNNTADTSGPGKIIHVRRNPGEPLVS